MADPAMDIATGGDQPEPRPTYFNPKTSPSDIAPKQAQTVEPDPSIRSFLTSTPMSQQSFSDDQGSQPSNTLTPWTAPKTNDAKTRPDKDIEAQLVDRKQERNQTLDAVMSLMQKRQGMVGDMNNMQPPPMPNLRDIPKTPDWQMRSSLQVFQSPLTWLAIAGSLLTRRPALNAMAAATGMMEGFHTGDQERIKLEQEKFKQNVDSLLAQNQKEMQKNMAAWHNNNFTWEQKQAALAANFADSKDLIGMDALRGGNTEDIWRYFELRQKSYDALQIAKQRWPYGAGGSKAGMIGTPEQTQQFLDSAGWNADTIKDAAITFNQTGKTPTNLGNRATAGIVTGAVRKQANDLLKEQAEAEGRPVADLIKERNDGWQMYKSHQVGIQRFTSGPQGNTIRSLGVAVDHIHTMEGMVAALQGGDYPTFRRLAQQWAQMTGNPEPTSFELVRSIVGPEITKAVVNVGAGTGEERAGMADKFATANSEDQLLDAARYARQLMGGQMDGLQRQFRAATGLTGKTGDTLFFDMIGEQGRAQLQRGRGQSPSQAAPLQVSNGWVWETLPDGSKRALRKANPGE